MEYNPEEDGGEEQEQAPIPTRPSVCPPANSRVASFLGQTSECPNKYVHFRPLVGLDGHMTLPPPTTTTEISLPRQTLYYRMFHGDSLLVRAMLEAHGFKETTQDTGKWTILWAGIHLKPYMMGILAPHQRINHFPRTYEITNKARLCKSVQAMAKKFGQRHFDFLPATFILPEEYALFEADSRKGTITQGGVACAPWYIIKPQTLSRGRGIFLTSNPKVVPSDEPCVASRYLRNPLLVDGYKFDLRIYVSMTSVDPLVIYRHEYGLARFATEKYSPQERYQDNRFMHLTNYSVNKNNSLFVENRDADVDDFGSKWSLRALWAHLRANHIDVDGLLGRIDDLIVKTILSAEHEIFPASQRYLPTRSVPTPPCPSLRLPGREAEPSSPPVLDTALIAVVDVTVRRHHAFELFGFDILVDDQLKPWVLEVNLSPSLACGSPLDSFIKNAVVSELLNMAAIPAQADESAKGTRGYGAPPPRSLQKQLRKGAFNPETLTVEERAIIRELAEEDARRGSWSRIYPTLESHQYDVFFEKPRPHNQLVIDSLIYEAGLAAPAAHPATAPGGRPSSPLAPWSAGPGLPPLTSGKSIVSAAARAGLPSIHAILGRGPAGMSLMQGRELFAEYLRRLRRRLLRQAAQASSGGPSADLDPGEVALVDQFLVQHGTAAHSAPSHVAVTRHIREHMDDADPAGHPTPTGPAEAQVAPGHPPLQEAPATAPTPSGAAPLPMPRRPSSALRRGAPGEPEQLAHGTPSPAEVARVLRAVGQLDEFIAAYKGATQRMKLDEDGLDGVTHRHFRHLLDTASDVDLEGMLVRYLEGVRTRTGEAGIPDTLVRLPEWEVVPEAAPDFTVEINGIPDGDVPGAEASSTATATADACRGPPRTSASSSPSPSPSSSPSSSASPAPAHDSVTRLLPPPPTMPATATAASAAAAIAMAAPSCIDSRHPQPPPHAPAPCARASPVPTPTPSVTSALGEHHGRGGPQLHTAQRKLDRFLWGIPKAPFVTVYSEQSCQHDQPKFCVPWGNKGRREPMAALFLPNLRDKRSIDGVLRGTRDRLVVLRFGRESDPECMLLDDILGKSERLVANMAVIYLIDVDAVPVYTQYFDITRTPAVIFFFNAQHMKVDYGTPDHTKWIGSFSTKDDFIALIEVLYRGALRGKYIVDCPIDPRHIPQYQLLYKGY
ncbi:putative Tubulin polyglutamylase TTLL5 [Paratrimastix pyriformis]|uniref:Tubulin--tyrosine ligase-like protein 5 n=1 Tax=Paratrimastix pyriformis TaxID=342808 RepID=A0ABQ8USA3_9EUKA|nr:putative Tubulin polyglutamylase TTLL5 [Paratrimastix pyriformis]